MYSRNVTKLFTPAFTKLNATMKGIRSHTAAAGTPIKSGVITMFAAAITTAIATVPHRRPTMACFLVFSFLYIRPATITSVQVAIMCIMIPYAPLAELTVRP